jgi:methionyl-tRNA formyltransferase
LKIVFLGTPSEAATCLRALVEAGHEVDRVITRPDRRRGRGSAASPSAVSLAAQELGLSVHDNLDGITELGADIGVVVAYGAIIPSAVLDELTMVNVHFSLLPRWRGAAPVERAILDGDDRTGVCIMAVEPTLDTGAVYALRECAVGERTARELRDELAKLGAEALVSVLALGASSTPVAQVGEPTYAKKLLKGELDLAADDPAVVAVRKIRCGPSAVVIEGRRVQLLAADLADSQLSGTPGTLHSVDGAVVLTTVDGFFS